MLQAVQKALRPSRHDSLAQAFSRVGWAGFWMQIAIGAIPLILATYAILFGSGRAAGTRSGFPLIQYLTVGSLLVLMFTTVWFYRYTRIAKRFDDPAQLPTESSVQRAAWVGVTASTLGIGFSILVLFFEMSQLLLYFLRAPQAGIPVIQTTGGPASWVSASDILCLLALIIAMFIELVVLGLSLWLLFRATTVASREFPHRGDEA